MDHGYRSNHWDHDDRVFLLRLLMFQNLPGCRVHRQSGSAAPQVMSSRDDLQSPTPLAWDSWRETAPTTIEVTFLSGPASCTGIHATVVETTNDITIDLMQGALPGSVNCPAIALTSTTTIDLGQPRGDRDVIQSAS